MGSEPGKSKAAQKAKRLFSIGQDRFVASDFSNTSILVSYYLFLALFPLMIFVGNLLPYMQVSAAAILDYLRITFPATVWEVIEPTIEGLLTTPNPALFFASIIAFCGAAMKGVQQLYVGLTKVYSIEKRAGFWMGQVISVLAIILVLALLLVFVLIFVFGEMLIEAVSGTAPWVAGISTTLWGVRGYLFALFLFILFCILYRLLPYGKLKLNEVWPGALLTTIGLVILSDMFALYVHFAANSFAVYGAISVFFVLMVWLNFSCSLMMAGALMNATLREYRHTYSSKKEPQEKAEEGSLAEITGREGNDS